MACGFHFDALKVYEVISKSHFLSVSTKTSMDRLGSEVIKAH